jgi:hypothetical protein
MRSLFLPLCAASLAANASGPVKLSVVVHTTDRVVWNYVCSEEPGRDRPVLRSELHEKGSWTWHATGGVAPYRVLARQEQGNDRCITVQDAEGNVAQACGVIAERVERQVIDCRQEQEEGMGLQAVPAPPVGGVMAGGSAAGKTRPAYVPPVKVPDPVPCPVSPLPRRPDTPGPTTGTPFPAVHPMRERADRSPLPATVQPIPAPRVLPTSVGGTSTPHPAAASPVQAPVNKK